MFQLIFPRGDEQLTETKSKESHLGGRVDQLKFSIWNAQSGNDTTKQIEGRCVASSELILPNDDHRWGSVLDSNQNRTDAFQRVALFVLHLNH